MFDIVFLLFNKLAFSQQQIGIASFVCRCFLGFVVKFMVENKGGFYKR